MIDQNSSIATLLRQLQKVPYLASKNLYVVAQHFLDADVKDIEVLCSALQSIKTDLEKCDQCFVWKERNSSCYFCSANKRDRATVCVVETWRDLIAIEKAGGYTGLYHILGGLICPLEGVSPDDLTIAQLVNRVAINKDIYKEVIFAFNQTPEGEVTAAYINSKLKDLGVKVSCLARGLPVGSNLESMDRLTVYKAIAERRVF